MSMNENARNGDAPVRRFPIVGIGASAGGLEALKAFFSRIPANGGIGFVVVTHVMPDRQSLLPELLSNVASIPVFASEDDVRVEPDTVVVAKDSLLTIKGGVLRSARPEEKNDAPHHPIDHFFRSLADDQRDHAICVVLSGSGNDGTLGLRAVKAAGGMAMVQKPDTAEYTGMPQSAEATELADYVLPPGDLPEALLEYVNGPYLKLAGRSESIGLPEEGIHAILVRLRTYTGQDFTGYKKSTMSRRIQRRMNVHRIDEPGTYLRYLKENPFELNILLHELLISVTSFFRDPEAFEALEKKAIPEILAERPEGHILRVWVPGCATGEEAYSIAILFHELIRKSERMRQVQIFATDLDEQAIDVARRGLYPEGITADVSGERLDKYFSHEDGSYRVHKNIRDMIVFAVQNIISDPPFTRVDLIVCRNVLIYLDNDVQNRVFANFHYALRPGGMLFLGSSETVGWTRDLFDAVDSRHKVLRKKIIAKTERPQFSVSPAHGRYLAQPGQQGQSPRMTDIQLSRLVERLLLDRFTPCSVVVDENGTIVYLHGRSGMYFQPEQGTPKNRVTEMAREGLGPALTGALLDARNGGREVFKYGVMVKTNGDFTKTDVTVHPLTAPEPLKGLFLVTLEPSADDRTPPAQAGRQLADENEKAELERELQYTKENLQSTIEELQSTNEELKSSNEELQSTNEELQSSNEELETSREEMQSLNEELSTVNAELQSKVDQLAQANDDMSNLLNSMQVATIFLDNGLLVKRYTEKARDVIRLIGSDIGRPLSDLTSSLRYPEIIEDCEKVLRTLIPQEKEVRDTGGKWHLVRLLPYRTTNNVIDGIVMSILDIDRRREAERLASEGGILVNGMITVVHEPVLLLDSRLGVIDGNEAFYAAFSIAVKPSDGLTAYDLGNGRLDTPAMRSLLETELRGSDVVKDYRVEFELDGLGPAVFFVNATRVRAGADGGSGERDMILLAFRKDGDETHGKRTGTAG